MKRILMVWFLGVGLCLAGTSNGFAAKQKTKHSPRNVKKNSKYRGSSVRKKTRRKARRYRRRYKKRTRRGKRTRRYRVRRKSSRRYRRKSRRYKRRARSRRYRSRRYKRRARSRRWLRSRKRRRWLSRRKKRLRGRKVAQATPKAAPSVPLNAYKLPAREDAQEPQRSLADIMKVVKRNNLDLKILRERVVQAELIRAKTWAMLKPNFSLQGSYTRNEVEVSFGTTVITPINQAVFQAKVQWAFLNFRAIPLLQLAYRTVDQVGQTAKQVRRELLYATTRAYYGVLLSDGFVDISRESLKNAYENLRIAKARLQEGAAPSLLVTRAELDVVKAKRSLIQARVSLRNTKLALAMLLNKSNYKFRPVRPTAPQLPSGSLQDWTKKAMSRRAECKAAKIAVDIAQKRVNELWMQYLPTVALVGSFQKTNFGGLADRDTQWSLTLVAQLNLYDGGARHANLADAHSKYRQASLEYKKAKRQVQNEISQVRLNLKNTKQSLKVAKKQLDLAQRSYKITQERLKANSATPIEVSEALALVNASKIGYLREKLNYELALLNVKRVLGEFKTR